MFNKKIIEIKYLTTGTIHPWTHNDDIQTERENGRHDNHKTHETGTTNPRAYDNIQTEH